MSCGMYTPYEGPDAMLLERNGKLTVDKVSGNPASLGGVDNYCLILLTLCP